MSEPVKAPMTEKDKLKNKCPKCGRPWSFGVLGTNTLLEVQCGNRVCKERFVVSVQ